MTGFGLLGHSLEMARASNTRFVIEAAALPILPGALELARAGVETGGAGHNRRFVGEAFDLGPGVRADLATIAYDPQTSGGLLAAVPQDRLAETESGLVGAGVTAWQVGRVEALRSGETPGVALV